jgi:hypothetical protein
MKVGDKICIEIANPYNKKEVDRFIRTITSETESHFITNNGEKIDKKKPHHQNDATNTTSRVITEEESNKIKSEVYLDASYKVLLGSIKEIKPYELTTQQKVKFINVVDDIIKEWVKNKKKEIL